MSESDEAGEVTADAGGKPGTQMIIDVGAYLVARLLLAALLGVAIFFLGRLLTVDFPLTVAVLFAIVLAFPLGIWVFAPLRKKATASIATFDERRRVDREQLQARLRGDEPGAQKG